MGARAPRTICGMTRRLPRRALALCAGGLLLLSSHPATAHADPVSPSTLEAWQAPVSAGLSRDGSLSDVAGHVGRQRLGGGPAERLGHLAEPWRDHPLGRHALERGRHPRRSHRRRPPAFDRGGLRRPSCGPSAKAMTACRTSREGTARFDRVTSTGCASATGSAGWPPRRAGWSPSAAATSNH